MTKYNWKKRSSEPAFEVGLEVVIMELIDGEFVEGKRGRIVGEIDEKPLIAVGKKTLVGGENGVMWKRYVKGETKKDREIPLFSSWALKPS